MSPSTPLTHCRLIAAVFMALVPAVHAQRVAQPPPPYEFPAVAYFAQTSFTNRVARTLLAGQFPRTLISGEPVQGRGLGVDQRRCHVYAALGMSATSTTGRIVRVNTDGSGFTTILSHPGYGDLLRFAPVGVELDLVAERIYWISPTQSHRIGSCRMDGSDPRSAAEAIHMSPLVNPRSIHVDAINGCIYWWDVNYQGFRRADVDSSGVVTSLADVCFTGLARSFDVDVENQAFYWTVSVGSVHEVRRAPIPATSPCDLSTGGYTVFTTESRLFFTDCLSVSPEAGVVAWVSANAELSWKPIDAAPATPIRRSAALPYLPSGGLEVVPGPYVCFKLR